jgi:hypothetical protein
MALMVLMGALMAFGFGILLSTIPLMTVFENIPKGLSVLGAINFV